MTGNFRASRPAIAAFILAGFPLLGFAAQDPSVILTASINTNQLELTLNCESGVTYVLEASTNLQHWTALDTNSEPNMLRHFLVAPTNDWNFYRVSRDPLPIFAGVLTARRTIDLSGNSSMTDSFDSADPLHSSNGLYDTSKAKDNGNITTVTNSVGVANSIIKGIVRTGPGGTIALGPNGAVGDSAWIATGNTGIQPGHFFDDVNLSLPAVKLPLVSWFAPMPYSGPKIGGIMYSFVLGAGNWVLSQLTGSILVTGAATLHVTDQIALGTGSLIRIVATNNASLRLYVGAPTASIGGSGIVNESGIAINFQYFGLPSNTQCSFMANANLIGCVYCPSAALSFGSGGNNTYDFVGAMASDSFQLNGHYNLHFDENLAHVGPLR